MVGCEGKLTTRGPNGFLVGLLMSGREALTFLEENKLEVRARLTINARTVVLKLTVFIIKR